MSKPLQQQVTDYVDFTGRTDAVEAVNVIARVTGYLIQMPFREGSEVKKGQILFEIDPRPYQDQPPPRRSAACQLQGPTAARGREFPAGGRTGQEQEH